MRIIVNGQEREVADGARVSDLIQSLELELIADSELAQRVESLV